ncbi:MAG: UDP-N-acetylmuramate--L-alanine ligase [Roseiflexaceae bacterium]
MHYHIVGIGGAGMSAIAHILLDQGHTVTGSDANRSNAWAPLESRGVTIHLGHTNPLPNHTDAVIATSAVRAPHPELDAAVVRGIPCLRRHDLWREWSIQRRIVAVAGTHGKTTTSAMIALALHHSGLEPGYLLGADVPDLPRSAAWGSPDAPFVIEADEYDRTFLALTPDIAVVTTLELDHVDIYPTLDDYEESFRQFVQQVPHADRVLVSGDDIGVRRAIDRPNVRWYGIDHELSSNPVACARIPLDWSASAIHVDGTTQQFQLWHYDRRSLAMRLYRPLTTHLVGLHNVSNSVAAYAAAIMAGADPVRAAEAIGAFCGARRRFEHKGTAQGIQVIDDYAHHPTEVKAVLAAARRHFPQQRIIAYVQPHTYSRTQMFADAWREAFHDADKVLIGAIYPAREQPIPGIDAEWLAQSLNHADAYASGDVDQSIAYLVTQLKAGDIVITMSAGDGTRVGPGVLQVLEQ